MSEAQDAYLLQEVNADARIRTADLGVMNAPL